MASAADTADYKQQQIVNALSNSLYHTIEATDVVVQSARTVKTQDQVIRQATGVHHNVHSSLDRGKVALRAFDNAEKRDRILVSSLFAVFLLVAGIIITRRMFSLIKALFV